MSTVDSPQSGVDIHHPEGDLKKISAYSVPASRQPISLTLENGSTQDVQAWQVEWSSGITEEGSSGSGLWNQNQRLVGVLSGGTTACAGSGTASTGDDYFGRLDVAWTANSASSGQLKHWLDPDNSGVLQIDGRNPGDPSSSTDSGAAAVRWSSICC